MQSFLKGKVGIFVPAALALLAALMAWAYVNRLEAELGMRSELTEVLVAKQNIPRMVRIEDNMLERKTVPRQFVQPGALSELKAAVNQVTTAPVLKGEQILGTKLVAYGVETGLAIKIPKQYRAVTLATNDVSAVAGLIKPGNYVDILVTFNFGDKITTDAKTYTVYQGVMVLAVGQNLGGRSARKTGERSSGDESGYATVTLALSPEQSQGLVLAQETGSVSLVLRSMFEGREAAKLDPTNLNKLLGIEATKKIRVVPPRWIELRGTRMTR